MCVLFQVLKGFTGGSNKMQVSLTVGKRAAGVACAINLVPNMLTNGETGIAEYS